MRVIGGIAKGRKLKSPRGFSTRPLLGRVKKSLFDIISKNLKEAEFLDLYAGMGSVGIEALSRGAKRCVFVEKDAQCVKLIEENLIKCGFKEKAKVYQGDVLNELPHFLPREKFDLIFIGPPYKLNLLEKSIEIIIKMELIKENGLLIAQHHFKEVVPPKTGNLEIFRQKKYGDMRLSFYKSCYPSYSGIYPFPPHRPV